MVNSILHTFYTNSNKSRRGQICARNSDMHGMKQLSDKCHITDEAGQDKMGRDELKLLNNLLFMSPSASQRILDEKS